MPKIRIAFTLIALVALAGCPKKEENGNQGAFSQTKTSGGGQPSQPATQPAQEQAQQPASQPAEGGGGEQAAGPEVPPFSGEVKLGDGINADAVKPSDVLFVIARQSVGGQPGPIVATTRHTPVKLPMKFTIGPNDRMVQGMPFTGPFIVTARLDRDGDPMTKDENDLYASAGEVKGGQSDVALTLARGQAQGAQQPQQPASQPH